MITWNRNRLTAKLGIDYPIIQGPLVSSKRCPPSPEAFSVGASTALHMSSTNKKGSRIAL